MSLWVTLYGTTKIVPFRSRPNHRRATQSSTPKITTGISASMM